MKRTLRKMLTLITVLALLLPTTGLASGLFDGLLPTEEPTAEPTPAPTDVPPPPEITDEPVVESDVPAGERMERHEDVSLNEAAAIILTQDETKLLRVEYDVTTRVLVLYFLAEEAPAASTPAPIVSPGSDWTDDICPYCQGIGDCGDCVFGECDACWGDGDIMCPGFSCLFGQCAECAGDGYSLSYSFSGENKRVRCSTCGGTGKCRTCSGKGYVKCSACNGSGNCGTCKGTDKCQYCGGTGRR